MQIIINKLIKMMQLAINRCCLKYFFPFAHTLHMFLFLWIEAYFFFHIFFTDARIRDGRVHVLWLFEVF